MIRTKPTHITQAKPSMTFAIFSFPSPRLAFLKKKGSAAYLKAWLNSTKKIEIL